MSLTARKGEFREPIDRLAGDMLDAVVHRSSRGPRRPDNLCLDKGYDYPDTEQEVGIAT